MEVISLHGTDDRLYQLVARLVMDPMSYGKTIIILSRQLRNMSGISVSATMEVLSAFCLSRRLTADSISTIIMSAAMNKLFWTC